MTSVDPQFRVFVVSLPRCGSSLLTGIVQRLGVTIIETSEDDEAKQKRSEQYANRLGEYVPNEEFHEITREPWVNWMKVMETPYSGCKVIINSDLCRGGMLWQAMIYNPAKVLMLKRDPEEIRQSQEAFYRKPRAPQLGETGFEDQAEMARSFFRTALVQMEMRLKQRAVMSNSARFGDDSVNPFDYQIIEHRKLIDKPLETTRKIAAFIQAAPDKIEFAAAKVDRSKVRFLKEDLEEGI